MRAVGLDLGSKRIGVAVSNDDGTVATPYEVLARAGDPTADHRAIARIVSDVEAGIVVVGLPLSLDGSVGPAAELVSAEVEQIRSTLTTPVVTHDERLSTVTADRQLQSIGLNAAKRRKMVDQVAAAVILQAWLDAGSPA
ncbi:MAG: Holliday junction resolvase RuvX [Acidimicrobiales bacterium]